VDKFSQRVEVYGTIDELNSHLGLFQNDLESAMNEFEDTNMQALSAHGTDDCGGTKKSFAGLYVFFEQIQSDLFNVGSLLATENEQIFAQLPPITDQHVLFIEKQIDRMDADLPTLKNFILPGGHRTAAQLHICRTVCRRAERLLTLMMSEVGVKNSPLDSQHPYSICLRYLNRLSDFFFVSSRWFNSKFEIPDVLWKPRN
ncbi:MAG: cob(I)yrinic acid a,c-diamide adenosyltransferase, partial [Pseudobdellovibrionaceae bacterium]